MTCSKPLERILLVDDDSDIHRIATVALEKIGEFTVGSCESGLEVVPTAVRFLPDLVLLDAMMPDLDGPATLERMRQDPRTAELPVVFLTSRVLSVDVSKYLALGALGVISKPFDPLTLAATIRETWAKRPDA